MKTVVEIVHAARIRADEVTKAYPATTGPMYVRIGDRQRELFARAGRINSERFGTSAFADLQEVDGQQVIDLADIADPVSSPELIDLIEVKELVDPGDIDEDAPTLAVGDEVTVVTVRDKAAEDPPRVFVRDKLVIGVDNDLANALSLRFYYPRLPEAIGQADKTREVEFDEPYDRLLTLDLTKWLLAKSDLEAAAKEKAIASFTAEETILLASFDEHVAGYGGAVSRFTTPRKS